MGATGRARAFDWVTIVLTLGSAVALLGIATVVVDGLAVHVLPKKDVYQRIKYHTMDEREEEEKLLVEQRRLAAAEEGGAGNGGYGTVGKVAALGAKGRTVDGVS